MSGTAPALASGDVVFISIANALYRRVAAATGSPASHVGILFATQTGWMVAESAIPTVRFTPLENFLARSQDGWFAIRRLRGGVTEQQVTALRSYCDAQRGKLYHLGFRYGARRQFCSKLVYDAFRAATGSAVGTLETFADLLGRRPDAPRAFWHFWFLGRIPWTRLTVTPASQLDSPALETVLASSA
jgi:uncharacterized protein YycO